MAPSQANRAFPECLDYARADSDTSGVWGGTTERERRHLGVA
jgi:Transcription factor WhiB